MSKAVATLEILDEVNVRFHRLDSGTMKRCSDKLAFFKQGYFHTPKFKMGRWDGRIRLFDARTGQTFLNLLDAVLPEVEANYDLEVIDRRQDYSTLIDQIDFIGPDYFSEYTIFDRTTGVEGPLILRDYQLGAINGCIKAGSGTFEIGTGGGKSLTCAALSKMFSRIGDVVVIVPNIDLVIQTRKVFRDIGIDCGIWYGGEKDRRTVTMSTWQSLDAWDEMFAPVRTFIVDEVQGAKGKVLNEMLAGPAAHVPFRFGCTGTLPPEELFRMQIKAVVGPPVHRITPRQLQDLGMLSEAEIHMIEMDDRSNPSYVNAIGGLTKKVPNGMGGIKEVENGFAEWGQELEWMGRDPNRMQWIAEFIRSVTEQNGSTLVLVERKEFHKRLAELLPEALAITGDDDPKKVRTPAWEKFKAQTHGIMICTAGIGAVGIDAPAIRNMVPIELGKSTIKVMQAFGRGVRPDVGKILMVYDIYGNAKMSRNHARERGKIFRAYGQNVHEHETGYL